VNRFAYLVIIYINSIFNFLKLVIDIYLYPLDAKVSIFLIIRQSFTIVAIPCIMTVELICNYQSGDISAHSQQAKSNSVFHSSGVQETLEYHEHPTILKIIHRCQVRT
jgi:hypothetical protein